MGSVGLGQKGESNHGNQRSSLPVYDSITNGNGNYTWNMDHLMRECFFLNDSTTAQSATLNFTGPFNLNLTFLIYAGETFNERLPEFDTINITTSALWRAYVRSARVD